MQVEDTVTLFDLRCLVDAYEDTLLKELDWRQTIATEEATVDQLKGEVLATAYEDGTIDGKNADIRKRQEASVLSESKVVREAEAHLDAAKRDYNAVTAERQALDAEIGLLKAWLYSQTRIG